MESISDICSFLQVMSKLVNKVPMDNESNISLDLISDFRRFLSESAPSIVFTTK